MIGAMVQRDSPASPRSAAPVADVLVVGGGVNGCGIARDLAGRGARVVLAEKDDLAQATSSSSTKLIHGGLRYLEHKAFRLVAKALAERETLLKSAPHIMWPLRFVMPHDPAMRPAWLIRTGLFLYDHLAKREMLEGSTGIDLRTHPAGAPLKPAFRRGFVYSDGWVDDARLVVLNALDAAERGAAVHVRTACVDARRDADGWTARFEGPDGTGTTVRARALVNAAGPWAARFLGEQAHSAERVRPLRLVRGSHIVVPKLFDHPYAYIFQNPDGRIVFAIPYERDFTLIGTTDVEHKGPLSEVHISDDETAYLCEQVSRWLQKPVTPADVVWTYSGVRPLLDDESGNPAAVTRDYRLELDRGADGASAPLLSVWGGKITTFRKLAEEAADRLVPVLGRSDLRGPWTAGATLPGGDLRAALGADAPSGADPAKLFEAYAARLASRHAGVDPALVRRLARSYGTRAETMLAGGLGPEVAPGVHEAELAHLRDREWARTGDDVLWRRSKLGLHLDARAREAVSAWMAHSFDPSHRHLETTP
jgi:glycerol-3-phosphate dehydrogenase